MWLRFDAFRESHKVNQPPSSRFEDEIPADTATAAEDVVTAWATGGGTFTGTSGQPTIITVRNGGK